MRRSRSSVIIRLKRCSYSSLSRSPLLRPALSRVSSSATRAGLTGLSVPPWSDAMCCSSLMSRNSRSPRKIDEGGDPATGDLRQPSQKPEEQADHDRDQQHGDQRDIDAKPFPLEPDVAGQTSETREGAGPYQHAEEQKRRSRRRQSNPQSPSVHAGILAMERLLTRA